MYDVFGLGNALVDIEVKVEDSFLTQEGITKGHMTLIDSARMSELTERLSERPMYRCSGGSAANTIYALQAYGHTTSYACKVAHDETGDFFVSDLAASGVALASSRRADSGSSGRCLVMISDDAERTMTTDLAVSAELSVDDIDPETVATAHTYYVEGYLSSAEASTAAAVTCREIAESSNTKVAVSLSDPSMIEFCRASLERMLGNGVSQIFCNEEEALMWATTDRLDVALAELKDIAPEVYVTLGAAGSVAVTRAGQRTAEGYPAHAVDTTGAGDIYAGACIAARLRGADPKDAARFANYSAAKIVANYGARLDGVSAYQQLVQSFS